MDQNLENAVTATQMDEEDAWEAMRLKKAKRARIWDKITTGILIFLMCSPVLILGYIFLWFAFR